MIRTTISDAKNRLSHYIRLVRAGEEVVIMDRQPPVANLVFSTDEAEHPPF